MRVIQFIQVFVAIVLITIFIKQPACLGTVAHSSEGLIGIALVLAAIFVLSPGLSVLAGVIAALLIRRSCAGLPEESPGKEAFSAYSSRDDHARVGPSVAPVASLLAPTCAAPFDADPNYIPRHPSVMCRGDRCKFSTETADLLSMSERLQPACARTYSE